MGLDNGPPSALSDHRFHAHLVERFERASENIPRTRLSPKKSSLPCDVVGSLPAASGCFGPFFVQSGFCFVDPLLLAPSLAFLSGVLSQQGRSM